MGGRPTVLWIACLAAIGWACPLPAHAAGLQDPLQWGEVRTLADRYAPSQATDPSADAAACFAQVRLAVERASTEPRGAEDFRAETAVPRIPEPMVFDLVRGLGARRGETEINVLGQVAIRSGKRSALEWAPEIEWAVANGIALEFELPFEGRQLEAYKFAAQYTFGTAYADRFIHGTQVIVEKSEGKDIWETTLLYIPGLRLNETFSTIAIVGFRHEAGSDAGNHTELILNASGFADLGLASTVGIEVNYASALDAETWSLRVMPQIHIEILDHLLPQAGIGMLCTEERTLGEVAGRLSYTL